MLLYRLRLKFFNFFLVGTLLVILLSAALPGIVSANSTTVQVDPSNISVTVNDTFDVNINITRVTNLTCWELKLYYLKTVLNCITVTEGPFLKTGGSTFFNKTITNNYDSTHGRLLAYSTLLGLTSVSGNGTVAVVTFKAMGGGDTVLDLTDTNLGDEKIPPKPIPHTIIDGKVHVTTAGVHDVAITAVAPLKTIVGQNYMCRVNVTALNQGGYTETFNITLYGNTTTIATLQNIVLTNATSTTITFNWNTTGFAYGNYTTKAYAWPVQGETDTTDNSLTEGWVLITIPGDINGDKKVDIKDLVLAIKYFGSYPGHPTKPWNPNADINSDNKVDIKDLVLVIKHFGEHYP